MPLQLELLPGQYAACRLSTAEAVPEWVPQAGALVVVARTSHELSIVCDEAAVPAGLRAERGFRALMVAGPLPLEAIGIMAGIASALADAAIPLLAISTFDTDYVLVRESRVEDAMEALHSRGYRVRR